LLLTTLQKQASRNFTPEKKKMLNEKGETLQVHDPSNASQDSRNETDQADWRDVHADAEEVPPGYWRSPRFIGSIVAIVLLANSLFIALVMPVSIQMTCQALLTN
jgi:hypothetical protein